MRIFTLLVAAVAALASSSADAGWWHGGYYGAYYGPGFFDAPRPFMYSPTYWGGPAVYAAPVSYSYYAPTVYAPPVVYSAPIATYASPVVTTSYYAPTVVTSYYGTGYVAPVGYVRSTYRVGPFATRYRFRAVGF